MFNRLFYSLFKDRSSKDKMRIARTIYENYYRPRIFGDAVELIQLLKNHGYHIVLVTGCLDFLIAPLAHDLGADFVYASELIEEDGKFTGEVRGAGARSSMKANFVQRYAKMHQICLSSSLAFGDSIADLCMLETVGCPHAVNPDGKLKDVASSRGWPIISWKLEKNPESCPLRLFSSGNNFRSKLPPRKRLRLHWERSRTPATRGEDELETNKRQRQTKTGGGEIESENFATSVAKIERRIRRWRLGSKATEVSAAESKGGEELQVTATDQLEIEDSIASGLSSCLSSLGLHSSVLPCLGTGLEATMGLDWVQIVCSDFMCIGLDLELDWTWNDRFVWPLTRGWEEFGSDS
ncbi:hypothetical protein RJ641_024623 [Dillenia turbinata]|uniref:Phosphoserine phosphatase n=1 Tax=Dillenia turbinata TaxID=194707 RepID=A0AAN8W7W2_9MAGN